MLGQCRKLPAIKAYYGGVISHQSYSSYCTGVSAMLVTTDPSLRKLSNLFLVSLAIADLLVAIFVMPWAIVNDMQGYWWLGHTACKLWIRSANSRQRHLQADPE